MKKNVWVCLGPRFFCVFETKRQAMTAARVEAEECMEIFEHRVYPRGMGKKEVAARGYQVRKGVLVA